jgi:spermidine synthase
LQSSPSDPARLVASIYAANTLGAILGAIAFSTLLIGWLGVQGSQQLLVALSAIAALITLAPLVKPHSTASAAPGACGSRSVPQFVSMISLAAALVAAFWLATAIPPTPGELIAHGRRLPTRTGRYKVLAQAEGQTASIAITELDGGVRNFHVSGKIEASSEPQDMRLQRMLGHIPALLHPRPKSVLVVGCGAGVTAGSFLCYPAVERVVICEIEPLIPPLVAKYFDEENYGVVTDDRVEIVYDDARHYVLTTREKFDVITSDPIHPWVKGAATLYTREYFERCKQRLNPGGVISQWVPLYESSTAAVKSELATFFHVFPGGTLWSNDQEGLGYDTVLLGHAEPLTINLDQLQERLERRDYLPVALSLHQVGFRSALDLVATFAGTADGLQPWLADAQINRDRNLRLQYLAGTGANTYREYQIYNEILKYRQYPSHLFTGSDETLRELKRRLRLDETKS